MYRLVKSFLDNDKLIVTVPKLGVKIHYKIHHNTSIDYTTDYGDNDPDYFSKADLEFIKMEKLSDFKNKDECKKFFVNEPLIIPQYDHMLVGFVYSTEDDPNNHKWWLDFRDKNNNNIYNYYTDKIEIDAPINTKSWHDQDPNGLWHGRYVISNKAKIIEPKINFIKIYEEKESVKESEDISILPENSKKLILFYNIREDLWFCDIFDETDNKLNSIPCKQLTCDAKMITHKTEDFKPKVNTVIDVTDISQISLSINNLIIRGKMLINQT